MNPYRDLVLPYVFHVSMRDEAFAAYRRRIVPLAEGRVLEIGAGSGLNLPFYSERATDVIGLDPSPTSLAMARKAVNRMRRHAELLEGSAERIPLEDSSVDTVVSTWTLCSIPDVMLALRELRRVLRPNGRLLLIEHGCSPDERVRRWQDRLTPVWKRVCGGCRVNLPVRKIIEDGGFRIERLDAGYMRGPKVLTYTYEGSACRS
jgi:ubiquinone/menaquinone biosynthesis C-methylase UbiE